MAQQTVTCEHCKTPVYTVLETGGIRNAYQSIVPGADTYVPHTSERCRGSRIWAGAHRLGCPWLDEDLDDLDENDCECGE